MVKGLVDVSLELSRQLDEIERKALQGLQSGGLKARQWQTVRNRVQTTRNALSDQLSLLMREVQAAEGY